MSWLDKMKKIGIGEIPKTNMDDLRWRLFLTHPYPTTAYGYDGKIHLERPTATDWRQSRMQRARFLGMHTKAEWLEKLDRIGKCVGCGVSSDDARLAKDHIVPVAQGGCDCIHNLQPLCHPCNSSKGARLEA